MRLPRIVKMPANGQIIYGSAAVAAAGTNQATGTQITSQFALVTGADGTKGVVLPSMQLGMKVRVVNTDAAGILKVYPFTGDSCAINAGAADASISLQPGQVVNFIGASKTQIWTERTLQFAPAAGTTALAPLLLTAGTNLTTPAAGAVEYDGNAFYATALASAREQLEAMQYILQGADSAAANNTGLDTANAAAVFVSPANGALNVTAGKIYQIEGMFLLTNTGTTAHTWAVLLGGTATFSAGSGFMARGTSGTTASTPATGGLEGFISSTTLSTPVVVTASSTSATEQVAAYLRGVVVVNAGGTLIPQMKASARPGATGTPGVVVKAGSFFRATQLGNAVSVGNWT